MKINKKNQNSNFINEIIRKGGGRVGTKDLVEIETLVNEDKLLEAFFSITIKIQWQLMALFHYKFHIKGKNKRNIQDLWFQLSENVDRFASIITITYSTDLISKSMFDKLNNLRKVRNQIAHNLIYFEPQIIITRNEIKDSIKEGIKLIKDMEKTGLEVMFDRK